MAFLPHRIAAFRDDIDQYIARNYPLNYDLDHYEGYIIDWFYNGTTVNDAAQQIITMLKAKETPEDGPQDSDNDDDDDTQEEQTK